MAEHLGTSQVRVTQILNLLRLAPEIQRDILAMPSTTAKRTTVSENRLRDLIGIQDQTLQVKTFKSLIASKTSTKTAA